MKRNLELVKELLGFIEGTSAGEGPTYSELMDEVLANHGVLGSDEAEFELLQEILYHLTILESGGFLVRDEEEPSGDRADEVYYQLTWSGHDLLESMRG